MPLINPHDTLQAGVCLCAGANKKKLSFKKMCLKKQPVPSQQPGKLSPSRVIIYPAASAIIKMVYF
jgi:hypothetical protein